MKYLNLFDNHNDYEDYVDGGLMSYPNVSYCIEEDELHYMKERPEIPYEEQYLTFEVVEAGTITIKKSGSGAPTVTIQYSTDDGQNWTSLTTSTTEQSLGTYSIGDKILIKGTNNNYAITGGNIDNYNYFSGTAKVKLYGNIMSLLYGDNFINQDTLTENATFAKLFIGYSNLIDVENLILPATTLKYMCYRNMFDGCGFEYPPKLPATTLASQCYAGLFGGCSNLKEGPELPATTLELQCYVYMFYGCSSLNYIKCLATTGVNSSNLSNFTYGVQTTAGTFVKDANTTWPTGVDGIPSGWTVQNA